MKVTPPNKKTTLVLTAAFQPFGFFSARSTIRNMVVGAVKAVDADGNIYTWDEWQGRNDLPDDIPSLRSSRAEFPIPTIVVIPGFFGSFKDQRKTKTRTSTLRQIYNLYGGVCQYCKKEVKYSLATKDHSVPRSKGGVNYDTNIVLACKKCNNKKGAKFPYFDVEGNTVKPKVLDEVDFLMLADKIQLRDEWKLFLGK